MNELISERMIYQQTNEWTNQWKNDLSTNEWMIYERKNDLSTNERMISQQTNDLSTKERMSYLANYWIN